MPAGTTTVSTWSTSPPSGSVVRLKLKRCLSTGSSTIRLVLPRKLHVERAAAYVPRMFFSETVGSPEIEAIHREAGPGGRELG